MAGEAPGLMYGPSPRLAPRMRTDPDAGTDEAEGATDLGDGSFERPLDQCVCCDRDGGPAALPGEGGATFYSIPFLVR